MMKSIEPSLAPKLVSCDFELAALNAIRTSFPDAVIGGCFFHLVRNMKEHLGSLGLTSRYRNDIKFALHARMITVIAFVPPEHVENSLDLLSDELPEDLEPLLEDTHVGRPERRGRRRAPKFPISMWSNARKGRPSAAARGARYGTSYD